MKICLTRFRAKFQYPTAYQVHLLAGALAGKQESKRMCLYHYTHNGMDAELWLQTVGPTTVDDTGPWKAEMQTLDLSTMKLGPQLGFRVRLSPCITQQGHRRDLVEYVKSKGGRSMTWDEARQETPRMWFDQRVDHLGFTVGDLAVEGSRWTKFTKPGCADPVEFGELDVAGIMTITNIERFLNTATNGMGKERAFGCGLMFLYEVE